MIERSKMSKRLYDAVDEEIKTQKRRLEEKGLDSPIHFHTIEPLDEPGYEGYYHIHLYSKDERLPVEIQPMTGIGIHFYDLEKTYHGHVEAYDPRREVLTAFFDNLPLITSKGKVTFDTIRLFKALRKSINPQKLKKGDFNRFQLSILDGVLPPAQTDRFSSNSLNEAQEQAVRTVLGSEMTLIWGPPGTGKTHTIAHAVRELVHMDKKVLILSHTNIAVDNALTKLVGLLGPDLDGLKMVRLGAPSKELPPEVPTLAGSVGPYVKAHNKQLFRRILAAFIDSLEGFSDILSSICGDTGTDLDGFQADIESIENVWKDSRAALKAHDKKIFRFLDAFKDPLIRLLAAIDEDEKGGLVTNMPLALEFITLINRKEGWKLTEEYESYIPTVKKKEILSKDVVGCTITHTYMDTAFSDLQKKDELFDSVIVDEVTVATLPQLLSVARLAKEKVIMLGDPNQLNAIYDVPSASDADILLSTNIFTHMRHGDSRSSDIDIEIPSRPILDIQYRMHPDISAVSNQLIYHGRITTDPRRVEESSGVEGGDDLSAVLLIDTSDIHPNMETDQHVNRAHVDLVSRIIGDVIKKGIKDWGVITPYRAQKQAIRKAIIKDHGKGRGSRRMVHNVNTIHAFQGHERDLIIIDLVESRGKDHLGFLARYDSRNMLNVSVTRARYQLIVICDRSFMEPQYEGKTVAHLQTRDGGHVKLPFTLRLDRFELISYIVHNNI